MCVGIVIEPTYPDYIFRLKLLPCINIATYKLFAILPLFF